jgi:hypothetical protein
MRESTLLQASMETGVATFGVVVAVVVMDTVAVAATGSGAEVVAEPAVEKEATRSPSS